MRKVGIFQKFCDFFYFFPTHFRKIAKRNSKFLRVGVVNKVMAGYDDRDLLVLIFSRGQKIFFVKMKERVYDYNYARKLFFT